jgi:hypothetical protein
MTNISPSEFKRAPTTVKNWKRLASRNRVLPDNSEVPTNITFPVIDPPTLVVLDTPDAIRARPSSMLISSNIQAGNSTAEIRYSIDEGENIDSILAFSFQFFNSGSNPVSLTNITSRLVINGVWEVSAACNPIIPSWSYVTLVSAADLSILEGGSQQPPIVPPEEDSQATQSLTTSSNLSVR